MTVSSYTLKPPVLNWRSQGYVSVTFVDDSYLQGSKQKKFSKDVTTTVKLLIALGLAIHQKK